MLWGFGGHRQREKPDVQRPYGHFQYWERNFSYRAWLQSQAISGTKMIYGLGIYNMKGALVCYTQAVESAHACRC